MSDVKAVEQLVNKYADLKTEISKKIIGQEKVVNEILLSIFAGGHALLIGVPGLAKTLMVNTISQALGLDFKRIQFTPDLMPSDVLGTSVLNMKTSDFEFKPGPVFSNIVLIDEINRAPAKTQAALFEVMEERQVTIDGKRHQLQDPFMVLATQNPVEQEGTYALPEAQLDRFLFKIEVDYPKLEEEIDILKGHNERKGAQPEANIIPILSPEKLKELKTQIFDIKIEEKLLHYIAELVSKTRQHAHLYLGASPRASIAIMNAAKAFAAIDGRDFVIPEDIKKSLNPVLGHRIILSPDREMEGMKTRDVIQMISQSVEIPR